MSTHCHLSTTTTRAPHKPHPTFLPLPSPQLLYPIYSYSPPHRCLPTITRAPPHTTSHLPSTTITPITLSDLFLFSPTQMSTHYDQGPPNTTSHLPSTT